MLIGDWKAIVLAHKASHRIRLCLCLSKVPYASGGDAKGQNKILSSDNKGTAAGIFKMVDYRG